MKRNDNHREIELVEKIILGDHNAFREIFDQYKDLLFGYSYKMTKSKVLAEEAVQEVFLKVWQNRKNLDSAFSFSAYLYRITQNYIYNLLRKAAYDDKLKAQIFYRSPHFYHTTEEQVIYADLVSFKDKAIANLPPKRQLIFRMSRVQGLSHEEIAQRLGISRHTVKDQIVKALKSIKEYLQIHTDIAITLALLILLLLK